LLKFHFTDNDQLLCYSKESEDRSNFILTVVNLDPLRIQTGFVTLPLNELEIPVDTAFEVEDLLTGEIYAWRGPRNYIELNPALRSGHILAIRRELTLEADVEYVL
jgi:starch synthase (maltosyl-transferring)